VRFDASGWFGHLTQADAAAVQRLVLAAPPVGVVPPEARGTELLRALTQDAVYQLK
jgi:hypothetical protein